MNHEGQKDFLPATHGAVVGASTKPIREVSETPNFVLRRSGTAFDFCTTLPDWPDLRSFLFGKIAAFFKMEPHLLPVTTSQLIGSFVQGLSIIVRCNHQPVGHTRLLPITEETSPSGVWYELGSTWIHPEFSGQNLCTLMYERFLPAHDAKNILATTTNIASFAVGKKLGFVHIPRRSLPRNVWEASCTCPPKKTGVLDNADCLHAHGEGQLCKDPCWFRVTRSTARRMGVV